MSAASGQDVSSQDLKDSSHQHVQQSQQPSQAPSPPQSLTASNGHEVFICQWQGCTLRANSPEQLYDHVCEQHIGRKSTNNLNLQCMWGNCRIHVVKRDHITSHIRVHVPLKPHRCDFCGKAFKRPQDLKKHVKTHADDSVILQGPNGRHNGLAGPNGHTNGGYMNGQTKTASFFPDHQQMHSGLPVGYGQTAYGNHGPSGYYGQSQPQAAHSYGNVSYVSHGGEVGSQASLENVKQGLQTIRDLFPQFQAGSFDPRSYQQVEERLAAIQQCQLPFLASSISQSQPIDMTGGSQAGAFAPTPQYTLPPMDHLRTKDDLLNLDQVVATMQSTIYDNASQISAAGVGQPGATYLGSGMGYRSSHSPTSVHLTPAHHTVSTPPSHYDHTPAVTPPSSAVSNISGNSPPPMHLQGLSHGAAAVYPALPGSSSDTGSGGYTSAGTMLTSMLSHTYDHDHRRRYSGGRLQKAQTQSVAKPEDAMDTSEDGDSTPKSKALSSSPSETGTASKPETRRDPAFSSSTLDPALGGAAASSPESTSGEMDENAIRADEMWVGNARTIEALRAWIKTRLDQREYDDSDKESETKAKSSPGESLYPTLKTSEE